MSVQTELTRISTAKTNIKNVVNSNTANTITNQKLDAFPPLINGTIAAQKGYIPWIKGEGKHLTLKNSKSGELDRFEMYGNTEQTTYSGKNKYGITSASGYTYSNSIPSVLSNNMVIDSYDLGNITFHTAGNQYLLALLPIFTLKPNTSYIINYTRSNNLITNVTPRRWIYAVDSSNNYSLIQQYFEDDGFQAYQFTTGTTGKIAIAFGFSNNSSGSSSIINNLMIRLATESDGTFEPYVGGTPSPNPDYPQEVKVVNGTQNINIAKKNLFDKNSQNFKQYYILDNDGEEITSNASQYSLAFTKVKPNTIYTIQGELCSSQNVTRIYEYDINKKWIKKSSGIGINFIPYTFTTSSNTYFLRFQVEMAAYNGDTVQLEQGSTATTYEPYQERTYPISLHGKNLFDGEYEIGGYNINTGIKEANTRMYRSVNSISVKPNTQYQFSINGTTIPEAPRYFFYDINKNKLSSIVTSGSFTTPDNCYYLTWHSSALKTDYPNGLSKTQIEEGSAATTYEPYYNYELCKVRDYKDEIKKSTGKNLFDIDTSINAYFATIKNGEKINTSANISDYVSAEFTTNKIKILSYNNNGYRWLSKIINLKKNTDYTISASELHSVKVVGFNSLENGTDGTRLAFINNQSLTPPKTFNSGEYNYYVVTMYPQKADNVYTNIQIEEGSIATDYEPYGEQWYIKKNINKVVLDGNENWSLQQTSTNTLRFTAGSALTNGSTLNVMKIISDKFVNGTGTSDNSDNEHIRSATTGYADTVSININKNRLTENTVAAFKTWLSNNPITVYYIVESPEYLIITNETLINQLNAIETFEGINNISIENENNVLPDLLIITKNKDSYNNWKIKEGLN